MLTEIEHTIERRRPSLGKRGLVILWFLGSLFLSAYSVCLHLTFRSTSLDLALHSQLLWNLARGHFMTTSFFTHSFCANHFWPGLYLLVPFHECFGTIGLLVLQAVIVAAGVFPVYYLTRDLTQRKDWATVLSICYLLHPTISVGVLFDFHPELLTIPCILASFCMAYRRRYALTLFFCILSMSLYEVTALTYCGFGALLCLQKGSRKLGSALLVLSVGYIAVVFFLLMPAFRDVVSVPHIMRWCPPDVTTRDLRQIWYLCVAVGLTPLLGMRYVAPAIPLLTLLTLSNLNLQMDIRFGYVAPIVPYFFLAAAHGSKRLSNFQRPRLQSMNRYAPQVVLLLGVLLSLYFHIKRPIRPDPFRLRPNLESIRTAAALVPAHASLSADNHLGAHFAKRRILLLTPQTRYASSAVDYILTDLREDEFKDQQWWPTMRSIIAARNYSPVFFSRGIVLLKASDEPSPLTSDVLNYMDEHEPVTPEKGHNPLLHRTQ